MSIREIIKGKDIAYESAFKVEDSILKKKDREKVIKLLSKIRKKENIAEKLKKSSYDTQAILKTKITFEYPDKGTEKKCTLLHHAIFHENNQAFNDLLQEAIEQKLLKNVLNEEMIIKHSDDREETHTIFTCAILRKDYMTIRKVLKVSGEHSILRDILNKKITIKHGDGQIATYTPLIYAKLCEDREAEDEILKVARDEKILEDILNENQNEQSLFLNVVKETAIRESRDTYTLADIEEALEECKESLDVEEQTSADKATETGIQLCENINENSEDLNISQPTCETSEKAQNAPTEMPNAFNDPSLAVCFDGNTTDKKDNPSTKTTQQRQAILAGFIGTALLAVSVALCIMEMYVVAVVCGIVGLVCMGFALHNALNPNTKLEKIESVEPCSPLLVQRS